MMQYSKIQAIKTSQNLYITPMSLSDQPISQAPTRHHFSITLKSENSALEALSQALHNGLINNAGFNIQADELSKQKLKQYAQKGAIWLTVFHPTKKNKAERLRRLKRQLKTGDQLDFYYHPSLLHSEPPIPTLIADYQDYSVWLKPRGLLSQGSKWADHTALYRWVEMRYQPNQQTRQAWIVHRLDKATQGLMFIAHSKKMAQALTKSFEQGKIDKRYLANVWGQANFSNTPCLLSVDNKPATSYFTTRRNPVKTGLEQVATQVEIELETGRKHQIRSQLSQLNNPIIGDPLYGNTELDEALRTQSGSNLSLQLTAFQLTWPCPISKTMQKVCLNASQYDLLWFNDNQ